MLVIHFTSAAVDPLTTFDAPGAVFAVTFLPLADGEGDTHISCLHLSMDGKIEALPITHAAARYQRPNESKEPHGPAMLSCAAIKAP